MTKRGKVGCLVAVEYVRRRWITLVGKGSKTGRWMHLARIEGRFVHVSGEKFRALIAAGAKRRADCWRHPYGPKPPTRTVRA